MIDQVIAREIELYSENTYEMYQVYMMIVRGVKKAQAKGTYNQDKALIACRRLVNATIKSYQREFGAFQVNSETRGEIAKNFLDQVLTDITEQ